MKSQVNFTPGPSQLYFTVEDHIRTAFREGIPSLSHRSKTFESIYRETSEGLRALLDLPSSYHIFFTSSATEIWERVIQNLVLRDSFHLVNGSFSKRFFEIAQQLKKEPSKNEVALGEGFDLSSLVIPSTELIAVTHNETSTGVALPVDDLHTLRERYPDALIVVDAVSSLPYPTFDYNKFDSVFFSVQKGFGLPAGLGVWMVNERCLAKAESILSSGQSVGSYHNLPSLYTHAQKYQTPETPNVLAIYLLNRVVKDMLLRGIQSIRKETEYKATTLYELLNRHAVLKPFVKEKKFRSKTVVVANCEDATERLVALLQSKGIQPGDGYGAFKKTQLRFANFPTHSKEQFECLADILQEFA
jgi:phosphoserine aminotransferase